MVIVVEMGRVEGVDSEDAESFLIGDFCGDFHEFRSWFFVGLFV